jgi:hypothetical protein
MESYERSTQVQDSALAAARDAKPPVPQDDVELLMYPTGTRYVGRNDGEVVAIHTQASALIIR